MAELDNPGGRLHAFLVDYREAAGSKTAIFDTWREVLEVPQGSVKLELAKVAALVPALDQAVRQTRNTDQMKVFSDYCDIWSRPLFPSEKGMGVTPSPGPRVIDDRALTTLGGLSEWLHVVAPEGVVPAGDKISELREQLTEAREAVISAAAELPEDVGQLLLKHIHAMEHAVDQLRFGGPGDVVAEAERLLGALMTGASQDTRCHPAVKKVLWAAGGLWVAFQSGPAVQTGLEAWKSAGALVAGG